MMQGMGPMGWPAQQKWGYRPEVTFRVFVHLSKGSKGLKINAFSIRTCEAHTSVVHLFKQSCLHYADMYLIAFLAILLAHNWLHKYQTAHLGNPVISEKARCKCSVNEQVHIQNCMASFHIELTYVSHAHKSVWTNTYEIIKYVLVNKDRKCPNNKCNEFTQNHSDYIVHTCINTYM